MTRHSYFQARCVAFILKVSFLCGVNGVEQCGQSGKVSALEKDVEEKCVFNKKYLLLSRHSNRKKLGLCCLIGLYLVRFVCCVCVPNLSLEAQQVSCSTKPF